MGRRAQDELQRHRRRLRARRLAPSLLAAVAALSIATAAGAGDVRRIRLCADPSNPPFSSQDPKSPGFEVEIARAIAETLGAEFGVHWFPTVREIVVFRQLYEDRCDLVMGLPVTPRFTDDKPRLAFTIPYYVMRQALVSPNVGGVRSADELGPKLVGVQAMTLSDAFVFERGLNRKVYRSPEETFTALATAEVDAIVMESPLAGWFVKKTPGFQAVAISDPDRELPIGAAVRKTDVELKSAVDRAIRQLTPRALPDILGRHGIAVAQAPATPAAPTQAPSPAQSPTPEQRAAKSTYLTQCSQCHGMDAAGTASAPNLRAFKGTEDDFLKIVQNGRPGTGMTPWKGIIGDDEIRAIFRYVKSLAQGS